MKKILFCALSLFFSANVAMCSSNVFESTDKAVEVKITPAVSNMQGKIETIPVVNSTIINQTTSLKNQKFTNAITNLDDAQVQLRQELSLITSQYSEAVIEKNRAIQNCKNLKKEMKEINKKMKNVDKSKKMINANLESAS